MHVIVAVWVAFASVLWGNWGNWRKYLPTILYMPASNLLYFYLTSDHRLWKLVPDFLLSQKGVDLLYLFIVYPSTVVLFLSNYPGGRRRQIVHLLKWVFLYAGVEWIGLQTGRIVYDNGWNFGWSVFFLLFMFPMLYLHHAKPIVAYGVSVFWVVFYVVVFQVPL
ncbi:CBO0543 family protein [Paenibacillus sp.]|uniref:CBO0543 family protein n=1 Tax=Paenibacillus sp. TaxID=58172 RepID=UPI00281198CB|nr:CBO0543 family protein [Paenibacillus sp.]